ncbi:hypothetical protein SNOG_06777 [Parastagonospora nodorum SN15]|uniref:Uncharacterized protein n=1 Tax=Phaeosphaeria nodorum (strain SN15 / ATCC MYA-4574 / FGSC 10173) TaxID=321614 RepID=Q0UN87_PHANO|nr:hypothetical protein SNOG_06777 [Parastagonospora nodorum SN15]EAT85428.1 hypothetical protein SNOG_06777 [Parastagonospora nodorum SN15]
MGRQCPEWITWHKLGKLKSGLEDCVASFGTTFGSRDIDEWLDNMKKKDVQKPTGQQCRISPFQNNNA